MKNIQIKINFKNYTGFHQIKRKILQDIDNCFIRVAINIVLNFKPHYEAMNRLNEPFILLILALSKMDLESYHRNQ